MATRTGRGEKAQTEDKPTKSKHRPSRTPTGLPGDEIKPRSEKRQREKLGEVVDSLLVPEHKAARRLIRKTQRRNPEMAAGSNMTLYERIMAYRVLKEKSPGRGGSKDDGSEEDVRKLERSESGWGSVDISQYTDKKDSDDNRSPTPPPTLAQPVGARRPKQSFVEIQPGTQSVTGDHHEETSSRLDEAPTSSIITVVDIHSDNKLENTMDLSKSSGNEALSEATTSLESVDQNVTKADIQYTNEISILRSRMNSKSLASKKIYLDNSQFDREDYGLSDDGSCSQLPTDKYNLTNSQPKNEVSTKCCSKTRTDVTKNQLQEDESISGNIKPITTVSNVHRYKNLETSVKEIKISDCAQSLNSSHLDEVQIEVPHRTNVYTNVIYERCLSSQVKLVFNSPVSVRNTTVTAQRSYISNSHTATDLTSSTGEDDSTHRAALKLSATKCRKTEVKSTVANKQTSYSASMENSSVHDDAETEVEISATKQTEKVQTKIQGMSADMDLPITPQLPITSPQILYSDADISFSVPSSSSSSSSSENFVSNCEIMGLQSLKPGYLHFPEIIDLSKQHKEYVCIVHSRSQDDWTASSEEFVSTDEVPKNAIKPSLSAESVGEAARRKARRGSHPSHNTGWDPKTPAQQRSSFELDLAQKVILRKRLLESMTCSERNCIHPTT